MSYLNIWEDTFEVMNYETGEVNLMSIEQFQEFVKMEKNAIIYQNDLNIVAHIVPGGQPDGKKISKDGKSFEILSYNIFNVRFKSFTALCPSDQDADSMMEMYKSKTHTESMVRHLEYLNKMNGKEGIKGISRTISGQAVKIFYKDIKYQLWDWKKKNKVYINTLEEFNDLHSGCKCGLLKDIDEYTHHDKCVEHDLSAAYCGAFIQSDKFPIGKPRFHQNAFKYIEDLKSGKNAKVIFKHRIPEIDNVTSKINLDLFDSYNNVLALEYYDVKLLNDLGVNIVKLIKQYKDDIKTFISYDKTGRTHKLVCDQIVLLQRKKETYKKGTPERSIVKSQMEYIYGKPIQKRDYWKSDEDVIANYKGRGENYISPQMSNHASAYVRYQIFKAIQSLGDDVYYYDTDGIKVADNEKTWEYFAEQNAQLFELNMDAGYDTTIGTWKAEEFEEILLLRSKMYITRKNNNIDYVIAGFNKDSKIALEYDFKNQCIHNAHDKIQYIKENLLPVIQRKIFIENNQICFDYTSGSYRLKYRKDD